MPKPLILFAHGAGAPSSSEWMQGWARRLGRFGTVVAFDYPYMAAGKKRPDRPDKLIEAHQQVLRRARKRRKGKVVLAGKSMGGRIGCHVALEEPVDALVCLGYPLVSAGKKAALRDAVLLALQTPVMFVQGTRDALCPLDALAKVRRRMRAPSALFVVESGNHSLLATKSWLEEHDTTQEQVDDDAATAIGAFLAAHGAR